MQELAPGVYYEPSFRGINLGLIVSSEGVVLVDTPMLPMIARDWQVRVEEHGPIRYLVNTDHLQEHTSGNFFLPGDIIAHEETRGRMRMTDKAKDTYKKFVLDTDQPGAEQYIENYDLRYPNITLLDRLTIYLGERELEFMHLPGHTPNSIGLYLPDARILFTGDVVVNGYRPYLGLANVDEWLMTLKAIELMEVDSIVPGHGAPMGVDELGPLATHLVTMRDHVQDLIDSGRARDEVVSKMMPHFEEWPIDNTRRDEERNMYRQGVRQLYDVLTGRK